jgi:hypothetical protein
MERAFRVRRIERPTRALGAVALAAWVALGGCHTAKPPLRPDPGVTGYAFIGGYSVQRYVFPAELVERAVIEAMTDMKMHAVKPSVKEDGVCFAGETYDGRCIVVTVEDRGGSTIVSSRFDVYGDEPSSKVLNDRIAVRLATLPQVVNPPLDPRNYSDAITHRGMKVEGYRGAPQR